MENKLEIIKEQEVLGKQFRIYGTFDEPLFLAKDVAEWIEYATTSKGARNVSMMLKSVDEDEKLVSTILISGQNREMWFLTEDGLYEVLMQSRKPIAKQFKKKVKAILKEIRKTGSYTAKPLTTVQMFSIACKALEEHEQKLLQQQQQLSNHEQRLEQIEQKTQRKEYPYPDKKLRDQIRGAIWNFCSETFNDMTDEEKAEYPSVDKLVPLFYETVVIPEFEKQAGINLAEELTHAQEYWREKYIREKTILHGKAPNKTVLRPSEIENLTIQSVIATNPELSKLLLGIISAFKK